MDDLIVHEDGRLHPAAWNRYTRGLHHPIRSKPWYRVGRESSWP